MHTWVRRGLRTALVTGGLLMLGTGIASADENVNPDLPPSPVDAGVSVPINAGHTPAGTGTHRVVRGNVTTNTGAAPVRPIAGRANPLVRHAQPYAQRVGDPSGTVSGTIPAAGMATPARTAHTAVTGLGAPGAEPAGWTRDPLRANGATGPTRIIKGNSVVHNGSPVNVGYRPMAQRLPSVPQNGQLSGVPVVPTIRGIGLFDMTQAQSAPASPGALPGAPVVPSVRNVVGRVSSRLPVSYGAEAPTSTVPAGQTVQSTHVLNHSPLDSLPGVPSVGGIVGRAVPQTQDEVPSSTARSLGAIAVGPVPGVASAAPGVLRTASTLPVAREAGVPSSAVQSLDARSADLPPNGPLPSVPSVRDVVDSASTDVPVTDPAGVPSSAVQSLDASAVNALPDLPAVPSAPQVSSVPLVQDVDNAPSHLQLHPAEAPTSAMRPVRALGSSPLRSSPVPRSPLGTMPGVPEVPSVPDVSSAPAARNVADTVPLTQAAVVPFSAASTTAVPSPVAELVRSLGKSTLGALPGVPMVRNGVDTLFSQPPVTRPTEAPTSVRHGVDQSPTHAVPLVPGALGNLRDKASGTLPVARATEVPSSVPSVQSLGQTARGALPGVPNVPNARGVVDQAAAQVPLTRSAVVPVTSLTSSALASSAEQGVRSVGRSALGWLSRVPRVSGVRPLAESAADTLPGVSTAKALVADSAPETTGVPSSVGRSVNESPLGALPGVPRVPSVPSVGGLLYNAVDVASSPTHATRMAELPVSDVDTSNLPPAPVESVSHSRAGTMFGVPTVRNAATGSVSAVPVQQLARVPGRISRSVNDSPFSSLPGSPTVPTVPSVPDLAVRTSSHPPVSYVTGEPSSAVHATHVFGRPAAALPGVSDADGIAGVLPVVQDLFPRI
jgi:hypothetical protein